MDDGSLAHTTLTAETRSRDPLELRYQADRTLGKLGFLDLDDNKIRTRPDLLDKLLRGIYELKPKGQAAVAMGEAAEYSKQSGGRYIPAITPPAFFNLGMKHVVTLANSKEIVFTFEGQGAITWEIRQQARQPQGAKAAAAAGLLSVRAYWIISEGSRVIPARNLVPVW
jgi:hypothetical protein